MNLREIRNARMDECGDRSAHTISAYAEQIGVTDGYLSRLERGLVPAVFFYSDLLKKISLTYGIPVEDIAGRIDE